MSKKAYIFLADGFEDIEGLTVVDLPFPILINAFIQQLQEC